MSPPIQEFKPQLSKPHDVQHHAISASQSSHSQVASLICDAFDYNPSSLHAVAPTQEVIEISQNIENSPSFVSSVKTLQNSAQRFDFDSEFKSFASKTTCYVDLEEEEEEEEEHIQKIENTLLEVSKQKVGSKLIGNYCQSSSSPENSDKKTLKTLIKSSPLKGRKLLIDGKDDENSSIRSPLEILKDIFADKDLSENLTDDLQNVLRVKAASLKEVSPSCNCAALGLVGEDVIFNFLHRFATFSKCTLLSSSQHQLSHRPAIIGINLIVFNF